MSIHEHARQMVANYHNTDSPHCADKINLIERICWLAIDTYNTGLAQVAEPDGPAPVTRLQK